MTRRIRLVSKIAIGFVCALPQVARASATYPDEVKQEWQLPGAAPPCTLCHEGTLGGKGTVTRAFGRSLLMQGVMGSDVGALRSALGTLKASAIDSDGDGISDYDELRMNSDPNDGPGAISDFPLPKTGCAFAQSQYTAQASSTRYLCGAAALLGIGVWRRRRIRPSRAGVPSRR